MLLSATAQPLNQLGTERPIQAVSCPLIGAPARAALTGGDCAGLASRRWASVAASGPEGRGAGSWGRAGPGRGVWQRGGEGEAGEGRAPRCGPRAAPGWATLARADTFLSEGAVLVWDMKSPSELWNSKNLRFSLLRPAEEREKTGDANLRLRSAFVASAHSQILNFHLHGFVCLFVFPAIFSRGLLVSPNFSRSSSVFCI